MGRKWLLIGDLQGLAPVEEDYQTLDHLDFPPAEERDREWILDFYASGFTMREICYIFHCNLYSVYVMIHPEHPKMLKRYRNKKRGSQIGSCREILKNNPDLTDKELKEHFGFNQGQIESARYAIKNKRLYQN